MGDRTIIYRTIIYRTIIYRYSSLRCAFAEWDTRIFVSSTLDDLDRRINTPYEVWNGKCPYFQRKPTRIPQMGYPGAPRRLRFSG